MRQPHLSRRALLAGGAAGLALAGCSGSGDVPPPPARDTPEQALVRTLMADKEQTIARYDALIAKSGDRLVPFRARHEAHLAELRRRFPKLVPTPSAAAVSPTATSSPTATPSMSLSRLRGLERKAAALRPRQLAGLSPSLAQLVAGIGACEALHAPAPVKVRAPGRVGAHAGDLDRLREALAAEHAAVFAYGLLGARTTGSLRAKVTRAFDAHRDRRDELRELITAGGGKPVEPAPSYALPSVPSTAPAAARLAAHVESGLATAYLGLVAATGAELRVYAALALQEAAARAYSFRPTIPAFPGMPAPATPTRSPLPAADPPTPSG